MQRLNVPDFTPDTFRGVRHFARHMLKDGLLLQPVRDAVYTPDQATSHAGVYGAGMGAVLFRSGCWQVELVIGMPNFIAPPHRHPNVDTADVVLNGSVTGHTGVRPFGRERGPLLANLQTIPAGARHGGKAGEFGVIYLSFQKWLNGVAPSHIGLDWEAA